MANVDRSRSHRSGRQFLPDGVRLFLFNRLIELTGSLLIFVGLGALLALATWSSLDPSLNAAAADGVNNIMGPPGAIVADLGYQAFGFGAFLPPLVLVGWGWRIISRQGLPHWKRHALLILPAIAVASATAAALPQPESWPLSAGLGGLLGDAITPPLHGLVTGLIIDFPMMVWALPFAVLTLALFVLSAGLATAEWRYLGSWISYALRLMAYALEQFLRKTGALFAALYRLIAGRITGKKQAPSAVQPSARAQTTVEDDVEATPAVKAASRSPRLPARKKVTRSKPKTTPSRRAKAEAEPQLDLVSGDGNFTLPPLNLLEEGPKGTASQRLSDDALEQNARLLEQVLEDFGVRGEIVEVRPGPVVTLYELRIASGIRSNRVISLADDIARSMSAVSARIASIPGSDTLGIELPNARRETVYLRDLLSTREFDDGKGKLNLALGKDIGGAPIVADLSRMPHLLIAGTTGSGKSVAINTMLLSLLYRASPAECRLVMIDPKMLELSVYNDIPHLLTPVVTDPKKAVVALKWTVKEMEERYRKMSQMGVRNINGYNQRMKEAMERGEALSRTVQTGFDEDGQPIFEDQMIDMEVLPFIVVVVDEMADLMMVAGKDVEGSIQRLAQMARAAGIHIIMATQRPSVDVITGTIKANFPTRISFQVTSKIDSRTILGEQGAEQLLGMGDMLYMAGGGRVSRVHGPFVSDEEVEEIVAFLKRQGTPEYLEAVTEDVDGDITSEMMGGIDGPSGGDSLFDQAVQIVARDRKASTSYIQRKLKIGYNRAARLVEEMEEQGMISPPNHVGKREVLLPDHGEEQPF